MLAPLIKGKAFGKHHSRPKSTQCSQVLALSLCAYRGEGNVCRGDTDRQNPPMNPLFGQFKKGTASHNNVNR